ncbi:Fasciclin-like arabinogalactan protein [Vigna angularis]|uniref:Fasciclin-like arabinogalactan protein n=1 Tax=Phaseolus angularis TaxID=3914 RepID=A0A8T0KDE3_PHAAN|nr:Fasciclin-like arabinogalactan protein [Vigna angularis]
MKTTQLINQLNAQLLTTKSGGITILAPDDSSFSQLKAGFLNSLSDDQKLELLQFHVLSDYVSSFNFDTLTHPVRTLAGVKPGKVETERDKLRRQCEHLNGEDSVEAIFITPVSNPSNSNPLWSCTLVENLVVPTVGTLSQEVINFSVKYKALILEYKLVDVLA